MIRHLLTSSLLGFLAVPLIQQPLTAATLFGPTPYLSTADIPSGLYSTALTELEDFEDDTLSINITANSNAFVFGPEDGTVDSVDIDDGAIDGSGANGRSLFCSCGPQGITLSFPAGTIAAGVVWTDGLGTVTFEAFGPSGSLGVLSASDFVDSSLDGTTAEDRFFGATDPGGITSLRISNSVGGIEVDHVQYQLLIPEPSSAVLGIIMIVGGTLIGRRRWSRG